MFKKGNFSKNALTVLRKRYLKRDLGGNVVEEPEDMFKRVAYAVAEVEKDYNPDADIDALALRFYNMMVDRDFLPNSPTLMNAGRHLGQLSACFVLPVEDSMEGIFETLKQAALIHKSGGGTGFSFSRLRPKNDVVHSTRGVSSGPISFMQVYDRATEMVKQGGTRRGANMGILRVDHPDILEFIDVKRDRKKLTNFNISVAVTDEFMKALENGGSYDLINPRNKEVVGSLSAEEVFERIVTSAWESGEPGMVFIDRINANNPTPQLGAIESTNPCGEQPLLPYESCNLGSVNLENMVGADGRVDWEKLKRTVKLAVHFLDNVIDANKFPIPQIAEMTKKTRKIGLGVMGFANMLIKLGIVYNSSEGEAFARRLMKFVTEKGREESIELARLRGPFPAFKGSIYDKPGAPAVRNATVTTIAPTGTISIIADTSPGIEPLFAIAFVRNVLGDQRLVEVNPLFEDVAKKRGFYSDRLVKRVSEDGTLANISGIPEDVKRLFVTAHEVSPEWHLRIQAAFQEFTDNAVSKTINFPSSATKEDVRKAYLLAYKLGLKGITVYRDGCREGQVITFGAGEEKKEAPKRFTYTSPRSRPKVTKGMTFKVPTGCENLYITINEDEFGPIELFATLGKSGGCAAAQGEAISRLISLAMRSGVKPEAIIKQLKGIGCNNPTWEEGEVVLSCPDAIGKALERYMKMKERKPEPKRGHKAKVVRTTVCPECGGTLVYQEGCLRCLSCGYSKCD